MTLELIILYKLVPINPLKLDTVTVKNSGIEVAIPAIFPIVLDFNSKFSANFLNALTKMNFEITTINIEYIKNFPISINMLFFFSSFISYFFLFLFIYNKNNYFYS